MKTNRLFLLFFSCIPGAGQMYQGYLKRGASFMILCFSLFGIGMSANFFVLILASIVVWFYSFFDSMLTRYKQNSENKIEDEYFLIPDNLQFKVLESSQRKIIGVGCILLGLFLIYQSVIMPILGRVLDSIRADMWWLWNIINDIPLIIIAFIIIYVGLKMIAPVKNSNDVNLFTGDDEYES